MRYITACSPTTFAFLLSSITVATRITGESASRTEGKRAGCQRCFEPRLLPLDAVGETDRDIPALFQAPYHFETTRSGKDQINELRRRTFRANRSEERRVGKECRS